MTASADFRRYMNRVLPMNGSFTKEPYLMIRIPSGAPHQLPCNIVETRNGKSIVAFCMLFYESGNLFGRIKRKIFIGIQYENPFVASFRVVFISNSIHPWIFRNVKNTVRKITRDFETAVNTLHIHYDNFISPGYGLQGFFKSRVGITGMDDR